MTQQVTEKRETLLEKQARLEAYYKKLKENPFPTISEQIVMSLLTHSDYGKSSLRGIVLAKPLPVEDSELEKIVQEVNDMLRDNNSGEFCYNIIHLHKSNSKVGVYSYFSRL